MNLSFVALNGPSGRSGGQTASVGSWEGENHKEAGETAALLPGLASGLSSVWVSSKCGHIPGSETSAVSYRDQLLMRPTPWTAETLQNAQRCPASRQESVLNS